MSVSLTLSVYVSLCISLYLSLSLSHSVYNQSGATYSDARWAAAEWARIHSNCDSNSALSAPAPAPAHSAHSGGTHSGLDRVSRANIAQQVDSSVLTQFSTSSVLTQY